MGHFWSFVVCARFNVYIKFNLYMLDGNNIALIYTCLHYGNNIALKISITCECLHRRQKQENWFILWIFPSIICKSLAPSGEKDVFIEDLLVHVSQFCRWSTVQCFTWSVQSTMQLGNHLIHRTSLAPKIA